MSVSVTGIGQQQTRYMYMYWASNGTGGQRHHDYNGGGDGVDDGDQYDDY